MTKKYANYPVSKELSMVRSYGVLIFRVIQVMPLLRTAKTRLVYTFVQKNRINASYCISENRWFLLLHQKVNMPWVLIRNATVLYNI